MDKEQLLTFLKGCNREEKLDFYNKTYAKLEELNKRVDRVSLYLLIVVVIYFQITRSSIDSFSLGPISIKDISTISPLLPVLFACLLFELNMSARHKNEVYMSVKLLFLNIYNQDIDLKKINKNANTFVERMILPYSYTNVLSSLSETGNRPIAVTIFGFLLMLPLIFIFVLPIAVQCYMLYPLYVSPNTGVIGKFSFWFSIYVNAFTTFCNLYAYFGEKKRNEI